MTIKELHELLLKSKGITKDSRQIEEGQIYLALKGETFDGNDYAFQSLEKGALYAIVDKKSDAGKSNDPRIIAVDNTLQTLWELARFHRRSFDIPVLGLTGTNGKTTTKEMIRTVLGTKYRVCATEGNLNNNIGVPLTLLGINEQTQIAVIEMGASHPGDINELVAIAEPDYGLITNVGKAHLLGFGSFEGVKKTKGELYDFIASKGRKTIFLNADNEHLCDMAGERNGLGTIKYGLKYQKVEILATSREQPFLGLVMDGVKIETKLVGSYNADNVLAAIAVGRFFGVALEDAAKAISSYEPSNNRSQMQKTESNTLIIDAYNANPTSMAASLDNFAAIQSDTKIALLGEMRELGAESENEHRKIFDTVQKMISCGTLSKAYFVGEEFGKITESFDTSDALKDFLFQHPIKNATVLIKGSRGNKMENVIPIL